MGEDNIMLADKHSHLCQLEFSLLNNSAVCITTYLTLFVVIDYCS